jgi:hypothetical protein
MRVGDVELLVEVSDVMVAGSQPTSALGEASKRVVDAFDKAEEAVVAMATSLAGTVNRLADRAERPDHVQLEFGLSFTLQGDVVVASASGEATLRVRVGYDRPRQG